MRVAVVDCGTNTVRLLIADRGLAEGLIDVTRELRFARLGEGVDATGKFAPQAIQRVFTAVDDFAAIIKQAQVNKVRFVATSAARDASNREEFFAGVQARLGVTPEVISGQEEADLSFLGALSGGPLVSGSGEETAIRTGASATVLVVDIGGGSTELIQGSPSGEVAAEISLNMGSVRLRERYLRHDPPTVDEIGAARQFISSLLDHSGISFDQVTIWIGVAGTNTSLSAMIQGLTTYDRTKVHNSNLNLTDIESISQRLLELSVSQTLQAYPSLQPERAEVICAGVLICAEIGRRVRQPMVVRDTDILDGAALKLVTG